jgi:hypothetical protein
MSTFLFFLAAALATTPAVRPPPAQVVGPRGVWAYQHDGGAYSTLAITASAAARTAALNTLAARSVRRFYGTYGDLPVTDPSRVGAWNADLHANGFESQLLLGEAHHLHAGACRDELLDQVLDRLVAYHAVVTPEAAFDAVHLDIEPHAQNTTVSCDGPQPAWGSLGGADRAWRLLALYDTAVDVRALLDDAGEHEVRIELDLPFWIDSSPTIDWTVLPAPFDSPEGWYGQLALVADGITLMTYGTTDTTLIRARAAGEAAATPPGFVRVAVNGKERYGGGGIVIWGSPAQFWSAVANLETVSSAAAYEVDLFEYRAVFSPWWLRPVFPSMR